MRAPQTAFTRSLWPVAAREPEIGRAGGEPAPETLERPGAAFNRGDRVRITGKGRGPYAVRPGLGVITGVFVHVAWVLMDGKRSEQSALIENVEPLLLPAGDRENPA